MSSTPPWGEPPEPDPHQTQAAPQQPQQPSGEESPYGQQQPYGQYGQPYGQQPYSQPYGSYAYNPPAPTNGLAIASLVISIAGLPLCCGGLSIVGAILGHVARKQIRERGENGAGLALAGVIVGWIAFGIFVVFATIYGIALGVSLSEDS